MVKLGSDLSTSRNVDDGLGDRLMVGIDTTVTDEVVRGDVGNGLTGPNTLKK